MFHHNHTLNCGSSRLLCENKLVCESHKPELHAIVGPWAAHAELHTRAGRFGWEGAFSPFLARWECRAARSQGRSPPAPQHGHGARSLWALCPASARPCPGPAAAPLMALSPQDLPLEIASRALTPEQLQGALEPFHRAVSHVPLDMGCSGHQQLCHSPQHPQDTTYPPQASIKKISKLIALLEINIIKKH